MRRECSSRLVCVCMYVCIYVCVCVCLSAHAILAVCAIKSVTKDTASDLRQYYNGVFLKIVLFES